MCVLSSSVCEFVRCHWVSLSQLICLRTSLISNVNNLNPDDTELLRTHTAYLSSHFLQWGHCNAHVRTIWSPQNLYVLYIVCRIEWQLQLMCVCVCMWAGIEWLNSCDGLSPSSWLQTMNKTSDRANEHSASTHKGSGSCMNTKRNMHNNPSPFTFQHQISVSTLSSSLSLPYYRG